MRNDSERRRYAIAAKWLAFRTTQTAAKPPAAGSTPERYAFEECKDGRRCLRWRHAMRSAVAQRAAWRCYAVLLSASADIMVRVMIARVYCARGAVPSFSRCCPPARKFAAARTCAVR